jgi:hypothetical protein
MWARETIAGVALALALAAVAAGGAAERQVQQQQRGALVETEALALTIRDGVITAARNKFTGESYVDPLTDTDQLLNHLPSGLGTQHTAEQRARAFELFHYPWWEHPVESRWPNQHHPTSASTFAYKQVSATAATLTYSGLTDGTTAYADETYALAISIDANGDIAITPEAHSPRGGVYGVNLAVAPLMPAVTVEAPVFDGIRITRDMQPMLWSAMWANYWDYAFVALNGWKRGAIGIWCPDAELKYSKTLYHMVNDDGLSLAFHGMNVPPFDDLKAAKPVTWKIQAFANGWSEAAAHFRAWRLANVRIAERPAWAKQISFVNMGVNAAPQWLELLNTYFEGRHTERTLTFAATIREEGFDRNHANNKPYAEFAEHMKAWKADGAKLMAYLNPVIMWSPKPKNDREHAGVRLAKEAKTIMPFQDADAAPVKHYDVQHLGHPEWQRWFLDWIKEYVADGADGIYHDEGQKTPLDVRGLAINNMTPTMGRADYHYKAQAENPNSVHGAEHQTSVNNVGVSTSIGGDILWGTAQSMRHQRIRHASPVSSSLHYPNGVIRAFPHYSEYHAKGRPQLFHWGMDQQERRAEIAGHSVQRSRIFNGKAVPYSAWVNELWIERTRATTFVWEGLRPHFPVAWDKGVRSYFRAADGGDFRYIDAPWGSALVEQEPNGSQRMVYARLHGAGYAKVGRTGAIPGWPVYNAEGPAGLHPGRYYCFNPAATRPTVYFRTNNNFSLSLYEGYVERGFVSDSCAFLELKAIPEIGNITSHDNIVLMSPSAPLAIWVNGAPVKVEQRITKRTWETGEDGKRKLIKTYADGEYQINVKLPARICVLLKQPAALDSFEQTMFARLVSGLGPERRPIYDDAFVTGSLTRTPPRRAKTSLPNAVHVVDLGLASPPGSRYDITVPVGMPTDAAAGEAVVTARCSGRTAGFYDIRVNGELLRLPVSKTTVKKRTQYVVEVRVPLSPGTPHAVVSIEAERQPIVSLAWLPAATADAAAGDTEK